MLGVEVVLGACFDYCPSLSSSHPLGAFWAMTLPKVRSDQAGRVKGHLQGLWLRMWNAP